MVTRMKAVGTEFPGQLAPIGCILAYAGAAAPTGWVFCDGSAISRVDYATLFTAISTSFGVGDGSTTFNVPDLRGRVPVGGEAMGGGLVPSRTTEVTDGLDAGTLGATGAKLVETGSGSKSQGAVINYIIRATTSDA